MVPPSTRPQPTTTSSTWAASLTPTQLEQRRKYQQEYQRQRRRDQREYMREYYQRPEVKARKREYRRQYDKRPEAIAARQAYLQRPEVQAKRREREQARNQRKSYGLSLADWAAMYQAQSGRCASCQRPLATSHPSRKVHVDHDHTTGAIRSLLCKSCNLVIAHGDEDASRIRMAADYLDRHQAIPIDRASPAAAELPPLPLFDHARS
jgi:Recombination endonuclease VII